MFSFLGMLDNYEDRKVGRYEEGGVFVSTVRVSDGSQPFETAVQHLDYHETMIIVEAYDSLAEAHKGHEKWVRTMTTEPLPDALTDVCNSGVSQLLKTIRSEWGTFPRHR